MKDIIKARLERTDGDVAKVARELGVSESWVRRVRQGEELRPTRVLPDDETWVTRRATHALARLRREVVRELTERVSAGDASTEEIIRIFQSMLQYDSVMRSRRVPLVAVDARQQSVSLDEVARALLEFVPEERLRELAHGEPE